MRQNKFGEIVLDESDICDAILRGHDISNLRYLTVESTLDLDSIKATLGDIGSDWHTETPADMDTAEFDRLQQQHWHMPEHYRDLDIAAHVLSLCKEPAELQRAGEELLMFQERGLMDLLRYLVYLVDTMRQHNIVWGVGRGSSVASFVLYLLGVHRINSLHYDLDVGQFLR